MDTSARFFTKLRNLSVSLQTETASLQNAYQNVDDGENTEGAVRVLHELHSEVRGLKEQVQSQLVRQQAEESDVRSFIKSCMVLKQRNTEDILRLRRHYEKYGYQAPKNTQKEVKGDDAEASANGDKEEDETEGEEEDQGEGPQEHLPPMTPFKMPHLRPEDPMRTPQLSDFGLSEIALERVLGGAGFSCEAAPTPMMSLSPPSLVMAMQPPMPKTPKCTLRMDEDDPQTPRIEDFGISEHTMCLNNDFTMDLHRRKATKTASLAESSSLGGLPQRPAHSLSQQHSVMHCLATDESMESPEPPVFCTPGFMITRSHGSSAQPLQGDNVPESPCFRDNHQATPEAPVFETPYINRLLSTRKGARDDDATDTQEDEAPPSEHLPSNRRAEDFSSAWCYNVPEIVLEDSEDNATPEMPSLESYFGSSLPRKAVGWIGVLPERREGSGEPLFPSLEQDGPTQTFNLGTPRVRGGYPEPCTPEMPDLSSVTQDICKLISQCKKPTTAGVNPLPKPAGKENRRVHSLAQVSEKEFLSLPSYLRQVPLSSLNQAIQSINTATEEKHYGGDGILMEELRRITGVGTKAPMYFLCLTELKRLEHIHGMGINSTYRVLSHS